MAIQTEREFYTKVLAAEGVSDEVKEYATKGIEKLNAKNEKRKGVQTKVQRENEGVKSAILEHLAGGASVASAIGTALGISTQKASSLCTLLVKEGKVTVADVKVKGKGAVKQYTLVITEEDSEEETAEE